MDSSYAFTVAAVSEDPPVNSTLQFDILISNASYIRYGKSKAKVNWDTSSGVTYVKIKPKVNPDSLSTKLTKLAYTKAPKSSEFINDKLYIKLFSFTESHLGGNSILQGNSLKKTLYVFGSIAFLILLIASINYSNLCIARSSTREKEIGMRKVLGAGRWQLSWQFLFEAMIYSIVASSLGIIIADLSLPIFFNIIGKPFAPALWQSPMAWGAIFIIGGITGLIAGSYPAIYLSGLGKITHRLNNKKEKYTFQKILVTLQFVISTVLIACIMIVALQMNFIRNLNLGFEKEHVVCIRLYGKINEKFQVLKTEFEKYPEIEGISLSSNSLSFLNRRPIFTLSSAQKVKIRSLSADENFNDVMGLELVKGRWFDSGKEADKNHYLVNETFIQEFGSEDCLGKPLQPEFPDRNIIGVVKDFHTQSLKYPIEPVVIQYIGRSFMSVIHLKLAPDKILQGISSMQSSWYNLFPNEPIDYYLLDDEIDQFYTSDVRFANIIGIFTVLAIVISCLGLLSLVAFAADQRTKEIGIRKILGASIREIVILLNRTFILLIGVALFIALPLSWVIMGSWLEDYAYRIEMRPLYFILTGVSVILLSVITVSYISFKSAKSNPADALRYE